ncbi:MAG: oligosaccharide flippase family protein, partial [Acidobacteria bacterium]|nr:oligosaccharide flippase family protein [Acidobacteriota bacterium]
GLGAAAARAAWLISRGWTTWRPRLCFQRSHLRGFVRFGLYQIGDRITNYIWSNADYMLVGRILGSGPLGIYRLAYETVVRPLATVNPILNAVAYPVFSKRQEDDEKLRAGLKEMIQIIATIVFPMMAGLFVLAPLAVEVVFGPKWMPVAALIQILSPLGVLRSLLNPVASLLIAKGRVDKLFYLNLGLALVLPPGYWLAAPHGLHALSWSAVGLLALVMIVSWKTLYWGTIRMSAVEYLGGLAKPALFSVAMAITVYALRSALEAVIPLAALRLAVLVMLGASFYALLQVAFNRAYLMQLYSYRTQPVEEG